MTKNLKKLFTAAFLGLSLFVSSQSSEAVALVDHKEIKKNNFEVLLPSIKDGADSEVIKKVNAMLDKIVRDGLDNYKGYLKEDAPNKDRYFFHSSYAVKFNKNDLFSITLDGYQYTGGAHGMSWKNAVNINLKTGQTLKLGELFKTGSGYENILNDKIKAQIKAKEYRQGDISFPSITQDNVNFYLTEELLVIYYQPYDIAPYVYGMIEFRINNDELEAFYQDEINTALKK